MLFGAAGFAMTAVSHSNLIQLLAISAAFVGVLSSTPIIQNLPGTFLRGNAVAAGIGIFNTIGQFGGFVAPYIIGITKEQSGSYAAGIMIIAAGLVIGALIVEPQNIGCCPPVAHRRCCGPETAGLDIRSRTS
jgi:MFS transporter, ACS family, tartrate transporter